jgi:exosortase/archaeosortase family protein
LLFWIFLILAANSLAGPAIRSAGESGPAAAVAATFGVSAIVWTALAAALLLLRTPRRTPAASTVDVLVALACCLLALLPIASISSIALTGFAAYVLATSPPGTVERRAAAILLAVTASLIWGRLFLGLFSRDLLFVDAFVATKLIGSTQSGNVIAFIGAPGAIVVAPGCSSLQGMSLALVFWTTVTQWFEVRMTAASLAWCAAALLAAFAINILRLAALVNFPAHFDAIHAGWGWQIASWATLAAIAAIVLWGARRDVLAPR